MAEDLREALIAWVTGEAVEAPGLEAPESLLEAARLLDALPESDATERLEDLLVEAAESGAPVSAAFAAGLGPRASQLLAPYALAPPAADPLLELCAWLLESGPEPTWTASEPWRAAARCLDDLEALTEALSLSPALELAGRLEALLLAQPEGRREALLSAGPAARALLGPTLVPAPEAEALLPTPEQVTPQAPRPPRAPEARRRAPWVWALAAAALLALWLGQSPSEPPAPRPPPIGGHPAKKTPPPPPPEAPAPGPEALALSAQRPAMLPVAPGHFLMGSPADEPGRNADEVQHYVTLTRPFWLARTEVTQAQWRAVTGESPSRFGVGAGGGDSHPVERVSWLDAVAYLNRLSALEGLPSCYTERAEGFDFAGLDCKGYRLPTEAEWEYAARAGTTTATYAGAPRLEGQRRAPGLDAIAWYPGNSGLPGGDIACPEPTSMQHPAERCGTHPVGLKRANAWGLHDMLGNVWEWTHDAYGPLDESAAIDPIGPPTGPRRVTRGGGWFREARFCRAANRYRPKADYRIWVIGLRPARSR